MEFCPSCGSEELDVRLIDAPASSFGLDQIVLRGVLTAECAECGDYFEEFPSLASIEEELRWKLAKTSRKLSGREFAFLRRTLGATARRYAEFSGLHPVSVSRIENCEGVSVEHSALIRVLTILDLSGGNAMTAIDPSGPSCVEVDLSRLDVSGAPRGESARESTAPQLRKMDNDDWQAVDCFAEKYSAKRRHLRLVAVDGTLFDSWDEAA